MMFEPLKFFFGSTVYSRAIAYKRQNFIKVVVHMNIIDQCYQTTL